MDIAYILGVGRGSARSLTMRIRHTVSRHWVNHIPKFTQTVEIDETDFFKKKIVIPGIKSKHLWLFGLYERETRLTYLELIPARIAKYIIPIIQKRCELGTTIISDA